MLSRAVDPRLRTPWPSDPQRPLPARLMVPVSQPRFAAIPPLPEPRSDAHCAPRLGDRRWTRLHADHLAARRLLAALCLRGRPSLRLETRRGHDSRRALPLRLQLHRRRLRANQLSLERLRTVEPALGHVDTPVRMGALMARGRGATLRRACRHCRSGHGRFPLPDRLSGFWRSGGVRARPALAVTGQGRTGLSRHRRRGRTLCLGTRAARRRG